MGVIESLFGGGGGQVKAPPPLAPASPIIPDEVEPDDSDLALRLRRRRAQQTTLADMRRQPGVSRAPNAGLSLGRSQT